MRRVKVSFILSSDKVSISVLAEQIGIYPYKSRSEFPSNSIAIPYWYIENEDDSSSVEDTLKPLVERINPYSTRIIEAIERYGLESTVLIIINSDYEERPEISITSEMMAFFQQFKVELCIDVAYEW